MPVLGLEVKAVAKSVQMFGRLSKPSKQGKRKLTSLQYINYYSEANCFFKLLILAGTTTISILFLFHYIFLLL